VNARIQTSM